VASSRSLESTEAFFNPKHNAGLTPSSALAALLAKTYGSDGRCVLTRRELLAQFGYKKAGFSNQGVIETCLAERGIVLSDDWQNTAIDDTVVLEKDDSFFRPDEVARRLCRELQMVVAGVVRVRYRDVLLLHGFGRNTPDARQAIEAALRSADLDMSPPLDQAGPRDWMHIRLRGDLRQSAQGPMVCQPPDWTTCDRGPAEEEADHRCRRLFADGWLSDQQREITVRFLEGRHTFGVLPTGSGKSLSFDLTSAILQQHGLTLCVSPLIALMADQTKKEVPGVTFLNSTLEPEDVEKRLKSLSEGKYYLVYITPERLASEAFLRTLIKARKPVIRVAIDEAHCVSVWGHSFRPDYLLLRDALRRLGCPPALLLTATAPREIRNDIVEQLGLGDLIGDGDVVQEFYPRKELRLDVANVQGSSQKYRSLCSFIKDRLQDPQAQGIVFTQFATAGQMDDAVENCMEIKQVISKRLGVPVAVFHGQLPPREKVAQQQSFASGEARIIVATNAFGLGIDLPRIRWVAHFYMPPSLLDYYQEIGRIRTPVHDPERPGHCLVLFDQEDRKLADQRAFTSVASADKIEGNFRKLLEGAKNNAGLRGPHELLYDRQHNVLFLPFRPIEFTVRLSHLLVLQKLGVVERLPENTYHQGVAYARFLVKRETLTDRDRTRLDQNQQQRRELLRRRVDEMEQFCREPQEQQRWAILEQHFGH